MWNEGLDSLIIWYVDKYTYRLNKNFNWCKMYIIIYSAYNEFLFVFLLSYIVLLGSNTNYYVTPVLIVVLHYFSVISRSS